MKCPVCNSELMTPYRFCAACGTRIEDKGTSVDETLLEIEDDFCEQLPESIKENLDKLNAIIPIPGKNENESKNKQMFVVSRSGDIDIECDLSELKDIDLFATGNVRIAQTNVLHKASLIYTPNTNREETLIREIGFKGHLILCREVDEFNSNHIKVYTDYCTKSIGGPVLSDTEMRYISREAVYLITRKNRYYIYCRKKDPGYLKVDNTEVPNSRIKATGMGSDIVISNAYKLRLHVD